MTTDKARAEAAEILNWWVDALEDDSTIEVTDDEFELLRDEIAAALTARGDEAEGLREAVRAAIEALGKANACASLPDHTRELCRNARGMAVAALDAAGGAQ